MGVPRPEASLAQEPLPDGWLPCDGSTIPQGPWAGGKTPDLNSAGLFLRGGEEDAILEVEEDQIKNHEHEDPGHSHGCSASSTAQPHDHSSRNYIWNAHSGNYHSTYALPAYDRHDATDYHWTTSSATVSVSTTCSTSSHTSGLGGVASSAKEETRPRNM